MWCERIGGQTRQEGKLGYRGRRWLVLATAVCLLPTVGAARAQSDRNDERLRLERLLADGKESALVDWFRQNADQTLPFIDSYLEGGLKDIERGGDSASAQASFDRAVKFAAAADRAFDETIFSEYAKSFSGWDAEQRKRFRHGQRKFREARTVNDPKTIEKLQRESLEFARPLGDWWGTAMALGGLGEAQLVTKQYAAARDSLTEAARINGRLRLRQDQLIALLGAAAAELELSNPDAALELLATAEKLVKPDDPAELTAKLRQTSARARSAKPAGGPSGKSDEHP